MPKTKSKTETKTKKEVKESFDLKNAIYTIPNPYIRDGFKGYIAEMEITNQKEFDKTYKIYMGDE